MWLFVMICGFGCGGGVCWVGCCGCMIYVVSEEIRM